MSRVLGDRGVVEPLSGHIRSHHDIAPVLRSTGHQGIENWVLIKLSGRKPVVHLFTFGIQSLILECVVGGLYRGEVLPLLLLDGLLGRVVLLQELHLGQLGLICPHRDHVLEHYLLVGQLFVRVFLVHVQLLQLLGIHLPIDIDPWWQV